MSVVSFELPERSKKPTKKAELLPWRMKQLSLITKGYEFEIDDLPEGTVAFLGYKNLSSLRESVRFQAKRGRYLRIVQQGVSYTAYEWLPEFLKTTRLAFPLESVPDNWGLMDRTSQTRWRLTQLCRFTRGQNFTRREIPTNLCRRLMFSNSDSMYSCISYQARRGLVLDYNTKKRDGCAIITWDGDFVRDVLGETSQTLDAEDEIKQEVIDQAQETKAPEFFEGLTDVEREAFELLPLCPCVENNGIKKIRIPAEFPLEEDDREDFFDKMNEAGVLTKVGPNEHAPNGDVWELDKEQHETLAKAGNTNAPLPTDLEEAIVRKKIKLVDQRLDDEQTKRHVIEQEILKLRQELEEIPKRIDVLQATASSTAEVHKSLRDAKKGMELKLRELKKKRAELSKAIDVLDALSPEQRAQILARYNEE